MRRMPLLRSRQETTSGSVPRGPAAWQCAASTQSKLFLALDTIRCAVQVAPHPGTRQGKGPHRNCCRADAHKQAYSCFCNGLAWISKRAASWIYAELLQHFYTAGDQIGPDPEPHCEASCRLGNFRPRCSDNSVAFTDCLGMLWHGGFFEIYGSSMRRRCRGALPHPANRYYSWQLQSPATGTPAS